MAQVRWKDWLVENDREVGVSLRRGNEVKIPESCLNGDEVTIRYNR